MTIQFSNWEPPFGPFRSKTTIRSSKKKGHQEGHQKQTFNDRPSNPFNPISSLKRKLQTLTVYKTYRKTITWVIKDHISMGTIPPIMISIPFLLHHTILVYMIMSTTTKTFPDALCKPHLDVCGYIKVFQKPIKKQMKLLCKFIFL